MRIKRTIGMLISVYAFFAVMGSAYAVDYGQAVKEFISLTAPSQSADYEVGDTLDTASDAWKAVVVYKKTGVVKQPLPFLISRDGHTISPGGMIFVGDKPVFTKRLDIVFERIAFQMKEQNRIVYNPAGRKTVLMFSDPDCPYCRQVEERLANYNGEYRVVIKHFPLGKVHPGAKEKAVERQKEWLLGHGGKIGNESALESARRIVDEDIAEGTKARLPGVPFYVLEDGSILPSLF